MAIEVPKLWPGETFVLLGCGPSLNASDVNYVRGRARVIAINAAFELAPWADVMYAHDARYWAHVHGAPSFTGLKYSLEAAPKKYGVQVLANTGATGLELRPHGLKHGNNSGYQAINLAVHLGASQIILLGYDMQVRRGQDHFSTNYPNRIRSPYAQFLRRFETLVDPLKKINVDVVNCTTGSALSCFPRRLLTETLRDTVGTSALALAPLEAAL